MFNCPEWRMETRDISILSSSGNRSKVVGDINPSTSSCASLVRVCTDDVSTSEPVITLQFLVDITSNLVELGDITTSNWVYLAEVTFYGDPSSRCLPDAILNQPPTSTNHTTSPPTTNIPALPNTTQSQVFSSCSVLRAVLACLITVFLTAIFTLVLSVHVTVAICRFHLRRCKPVVSLSSTSEEGVEVNKYEDSIMNGVPLSYSGGEEVQMYEDMNVVPLSSAGEVHIYEDMN